MNGTEQPLLCCHYGQRASKCLPSRNLFAFKPFFSQTIGWIDQPTDMEYYEGKNHRETVAYMLYNSSWIKNAPCGKEYLESSYPIFWEQVNNKAQQETWNLARTKRMCLLDTQTVEPCPWMEWTGWMRPVGSFKIYYLSANYLLSNYLLIAGNGLTPSLALYPQSIFTAPEGVVSDHQWSFPQTLSSYDGEAGPQLPQTHYAPPTPNNVSPSITSISNFQNSVNYPRSHHLDH